MKALEGLRSTDLTFKVYGKAENYPRRYLADYAARHQHREAPVMVTHWEMDADDIAALEAELGEGMVTGKIITVEKTHEQEGTSWNILISEEKVIESLVKRFSLNKEERSSLAAAKTTTAIVTALEAVASRTDRQNQFLAVIKAFRKNSAMLKAIDVLAARTPKFLYFSHYDRMSGELSINKLNADKQNGTPIT